MRFSTIVAIFTVMLTLVPGLVFAEHVIDDSKDPGYLFVLSATSGSLKGDTLTLNGVPNVIYFSDRPARKAGHISLAHFIEMWDKGVDNFKADPPNATLSVLDKVVSQSIISEVELMSVEHVSNSLVFIYKTQSSDHDPMTVEFDTARLSIQLPPRIFLNPHSSP